MKVKNSEYAIYIKDSKEPVIKNHITLPKAQWSDLDTKNPFKLNTASTISYKREDKKNDKVRWFNSGDSKSLGYLCNK